MKKKRDTKTRQIPNATIRRLSLYFRTLDALENCGMNTVSSQELGAFEGISGNQIRRDLNYFGSFVYFASRSVDVPDNMVVLNEDVSLELGTITYQITHRERRKGRP